MIGWWVSVTGGNTLWFGIRPFFPQYHAEVPIQLTQNDLLYAAARTPPEVTMEGTSRAEEEEHTHTRLKSVALRLIEKNQLGPAANQFYASLCLHFSACHFLSLVPLLLRRVHRRNSAQGSLYNHSWQPSRCPVSLQASSTSQPVSSCRSKMIPTHCTR